MDHNLSFSAVVALIFFCLAVLSHLCNFGRGHYMDYFCEIVMNLDR